jgi:hypothetical protein
MLVLCAQTLPLSKQRTNTVWIRKRVFKLKTKHKNNYRKDQMNSFIPRQRNHHATSWLSMTGILPETRKSYSFQALVVSLSGYKRVHFIFSIIICVLCFLFSSQRCLCIKRRNVKHCWLHSSHVVNVSIEATTNNENKEYHTVGTNQK